MLFGWLLTSLLPASMLQIRMTCPARPPWLNLMCEYQYCTMVGFYRLGHIFALFTIKCLINSYLSKFELDHIMRFIIHGINNYGSVLWTFLGPSGPTMFRWWGRTRTTCSRIRDLVTAPNYHFVRRYYQLLRSFSLDFRVLLPLAITDHTAMYWTTVNDRREAFLPLLNSLPSSRLLAATTQCALYSN